MRVLGVDPGLTTTGVAVVERRDARFRGTSIGALRTGAADPPAIRLATLRAALLELIDRTQPDAVAIERLFFNANARTAMSVAQASGALLAAAGERALEVADYTPPEVKLAVVGRGDATKKQIQMMVAALLGLDSPPRPADAADACALAICHLNRQGLRRAIDRAGGVA